ncbi:MAG: hypothetical protein ACI96P_002136, partial [Candidatus Azotimanducaceae bacterium]
SQTYTDHNEQCINNGGFKEIHNSLYIVAFTVIVTAV